MNKSSLFPRYLKLHKADNSQVFPFSRTTLYVIEEFKNSKWVLKEKGIIDIKKFPYPEDQINAVYSKYRGNANFRFLLYESSLPGFPEDILPKRARLLKKKISLLTQIIEVVKEQGFQFDDSGLSATIEMKLISNMFFDLDEERNSGIAEVRDYFMLPRETNDIKSRFVTDLVYAKLELDLSTQKSLLADLNHRINEQNKREIIETIGSFWHGSTSAEKMVYLLEFFEGDPLFRKWQLKSITDEFRLYKHGSKELFLQDYTSKELTESYNLEDYDGKVGVGFKVPILGDTLYLEHGDKKSVGIPYALLGEKTKPNFFYTEEERDYYYRTFITELNDIEFHENYSTGQFFDDLSTEVKPVRDYCISFFKEMNNSDDLYKMFNCLYSNPLYLLDYETQRVRDNPPKSGLRNYIEDRQKINSIWTVI